MADEQDTREVLFPQWMGADKVGLTIEQKGQGEIFVKEVKDESPAAHSGKVYEGMKLVNPAACDVICKHLANLIF